MMTTKNEKEEKSQLQKEPKRKFNLRFGYQDKETPELFHREVVISRRPSGADFIKSAEESSTEVQYGLMLIGASISSFGSLRIPISPTVLLSLNEIDRDKLEDELFLFLVDTEPKQERKILDDSSVQLGFGIERDGVKYDIVKFGNLMTGYDEIEIAKESQSTWHKTASKIAREVIEISTLDNFKVSTGALTLAEVESMDSTDFILLKEAESQWLDSFRGE